MIVLSRPASNYELAFESGATLPPEADSLYFFQRGRDALLVALRALRIMPGATIVVPAYLCESTIEPLRQADYKIIFIDIECDLQLDPVKVLATTEVSGAKAVLAVNYFGFPSNISRLTALLRPRGVRVLEDCCHSFLTQVDGTRIGAQGDAAIFSMRKTLPIPDGGALRLNVHDFDRAVLELSPKPAPGVGLYLASRAAESMVAAVGWPNIYSTSVDKFKRRLQREGENKVYALDANLELRRQAPSRLLAAYLSNEDYLRILSRRTTENYVQLVEGALALGLMPYITTLPTGCVPQWAPFADSSGLIVPWLREHGVGACHWPWHELPAEVVATPLDYPTSNQLNRSLALIPVHQSIEPRQIGYILHVIKKLFNKLESTNNDEIV